MTLKLLTSRIVKLCIYFVSYLLYKLNKQPTAIAIEIGVLGGMGGI